MMIRVVSTSVLLGLAIILSSAYFTPQKGLKIQKIVIDAGHGGKDPGALGKRSKEKQIALSVALKLGKLIQTHLPNVKVIYTRKTDVFVELEERADIANRNQADLFISIHANSAKNKKAYGTETFIMGMHKSQENLDVAMRENATILLEDNHEKYNFDPYSIISYIKMSNYQSAYQAESIKLASNIERQFSSKAKRHSRGVKQAGFMVLWQTSMPSVLVELGFLSNAQEESYLISEYGKNHLASSIFKAVQNYKKDIESTTASR